MSALGIYLYDIIRNLFQISSLSGNSRQAGGAPRGEGLVQQLLCTIGDTYLHEVVWVGMLQAPLLLSHARVSPIIAQMITKLSLP